MDAESTANTGQMYNELRRFKEIIDATTDYVATATPSGSLTYVNTAARRAAGWGEHESLEGKSFAQVHPDWAVDLIRNVALPYADQHGTWSGESAVLLADGAELPVTQVITVHRNSDGELEYISTIMRDISQSKKAEQALRESQAIGNMGSWELDIPTNRLLWSEETYSILELPRQGPAPSYQAFLEMVHVDDRHVVDGRYQESVRNGSQFEVSCRVQLPKGACKQLRIVGHTENGPNGRPARSVGIVQDISELSKLRHDLVLRNYAMDSAITGMAMADAQGTVTYANQAMLQMWGAHDQSQVLGRSATEFFTNTQEANRILQTILSDGSFRGETQARRIDGSEFPVLFSASLIFTAEEELPLLMGTYIDVSERKRAEQHAQSQAAKFNALINTTMEGYWLVERNARLVEVNEAACSMLGYSREELLSMSVPDLDAQHTPEVIYRHIEEVHKHGYDRFETRHRRKDGTEICVEVSVTRYLLNHSEQMIAFIQNVTARKELELAEKAREVAERANQAKTAFLSNISHEFRTPLNAILGFGQVLESDGSLDAEQVEYVHEMRRAGDQLLKQIDRILELTRIESGQIMLDSEAIVCRSLVDESMELVAQLALDSGVSLSAHVQEGLLVKGDYMRLRQALVNLLSNAVLYNKTGGSVTVAVSGDPEWVRLAVTDTGYGIPPEKMDEIFTPFSRLGREAGSIAGTGIGLAFSKRLVELMGGWIQVESSVFEGSTFQIHLPGVSS